MPKPKHRKNRKQYRKPELVVIWTNDDWEHPQPALNEPHVQADELAGVPLVTVWDLDRPGLITYGLLGAALEHFGGTPDKDDTLDDLRMKLTQAAADAAIAAAREVTDVRSEVTT